MFADNFCSSRRCFLLNFPCKYLQFVSQNHCTERHTAVPAQGAFLPMQMYSNSVTVTYIVLSKVCTNLMLRETSSVTFYFNQCFPHSSFLYTDRRDWDIFTSKCFLLAVELFGRILVLSDLIQPFSAKLG